MRRKPTQKKKYFTPFVLLLALSLLSGCEVWDKVKPESNYINDPVVDFDYYKDLVFGSNDKVKLDLYTPVSLNGHPAEVVILLHGGGWISGDKSFLKPTVDMLLREGKNLAIVNMNYRVDSRAGDLLSLQLADLQNVMNFLGDNAEKYNLRTVIRPMYSKKPVPFTWRRFVRLKRSLSMDRRMCLFRASRVNYWLENSAS